MLILLYGEDTFRSKEKLKKLKAKFAQQDSSGMNLQEINGKRAELADIKKAVQSVPFLGDKRLVIIEKLLAEGNKDLLSKIAELIKEGLPASSAVIFWEEGKPDKRTKLFKLLNKQGQTEELTPLSGTTLNKWITDHVTAAQGKINSEATNKLAAYVGTDLWQMSQEIDKLVSYKGEGKEIEAEDVDTLVKAKLDTNIFSFIDAIGYQDKTKALKLLHDQLASGEHALYLLTMITYQFRNLLVVKELLENGTNPYQISKEAKMHPFVAKKTTEQAANFDFSELRAIYKKLLDLDTALKTSKIEPTLGLDLLVVGLCG